MSVPNTLFIDTSIFDEQNYNFESTAFRPFLAAVQGKKLTYLLPDPTSREVRRHIAERSDAVVKALEDARRRAPFLAKSKQWPIPAGFALSWELRQLATEEWKKFLESFNVHHLSFEGVNITEIMNWYDKQHPPFSPKKRKEFPDALAIGSLLEFARKQLVTVAVISSDDDFKLACGRFVELLHFPSLPAFTEALIASDQRVEKVKSLLETDHRVLEAALKKEFAFLDFYTAADPEGEVNDIQATDVEFETFHVVGVGASECTITFEARVHYTAHVQYDDRDSAIIDSSEDIYIPLRRFSGVVDDETSVTGVAKVHVINDWSEFSNITYFHVDHTFIEVSGTPNHREHID